MKRPQGQERRANIRKCKNNNVSKQSALKNLPKNYVFDISYNLAQKSSKT